MLLTVVGIIHIFVASLFNTRFTLTTMVQIQASSLSSPIQLTAFPLTALLPPLLFHWFSESIGLHLFINFIGHYMYLIEHWFEAIPLYTDMRP